MEIEKLEDTCRMRAHIRAHTKEVRWVGVE